jgi:hypothetical protein
MIKEKRYVKPEMTMVRLRVEERLAGCGTIYYSKIFDDERCNKVSFMQMTPDQCKEVIPLGAS